MQSHSVKDRCVGKYFDFWSTVVVASTFFLFILALFQKGFTHDLSLEAGVLLVSLKLMLMAHKNWLLGELLKERLDRIQETICRISDQSGKKPEGP
jgi:hypothetical protein